MNEKVVKNFTQLHDAFKEYRDDRAWMFRGHRDPAWRLIPKAGRSAFFLNFEVPFFESWKRRAIEFIPVIPPNDWQWLAVAQHHGFSTRLLDWSGNPLISCFFAVSDENENRNEKKAAVVYAFKPRYNLKDSANHHGNSSNPFAYRIEYPIVEYRPGVYVNRISRQYARFTVHSPPNFEIRDDNRTGLLHKVIIHEDYVHELRKDLDHYGYNYATIFPDLDGISKHLNWTGSQNDLSIPLIKEQEEMKDPEKNIDIAEYDRPPTMNA